MQFWSVKHGFDSKQKLLLHRVFLVQQLKTQQTQQRKHWGHLKKKYITKYINHTTDLMALIILRNFFIKVAAETTCQPSTGRNRQKEERKPPKAPECTLTTVCAPPLRKEAAAGDAKPDPQRMNAAEGLRDDHRDDSSKQ